MPTQTNEMPGQQPITFIESDDFRKGIKALKKKYPSIVYDVDALLAMLEVIPSSP